MIILTIIFLTKMDISKVIKDYMARKFLRESSCCPPYIAG
jgi:hypothetical protein